MEPCTWTQADLIKIDRAIATGVLTVEYDDGRRVTYRDLSDLFLIRGKILECLDPATQAGPLRKVMSHSKGLSGPALGELGWLP